MAIKFTPELLEGALNASGVVVGFYQKGEDQTTRKAIHVVRMINVKDEGTGEWSVQVEYYCHGYGYCVRTVSNFCSCMWYTANEVRTGPRG
ncbi:hypothetical protein GR11A_00210 [Vibrio phage vB_VcorM_GR11A]|nr:hypothetical protein GR11A_00210 [Vibrio phage vB_VcorM_GR11A]